VKVLFAVIVLDDVPLGDVTCTTTEPVPAGTVAVNDVSLGVPTITPGLPPNVTDEALANPKPVRVTVAPAGPDAGFTPVTLMPYVY
jgi:hypothetical protein